MHKKMNKITYFSDEILHLNQERKETYICICISQGKSLNF